MQLKELEVISGDENNLVELLYEGDEVYSIIQTNNRNKDSCEESSVTITRQELFDICRKVFPNFN